MVRVELYNGGIHKLFGEDGYRQIEFQDYSLSIDLNQAPKEMVKNEHDLTFEELREGIAHNPNRPKLRREMILEMNRRFALPFACFVFAMVGVPLGMQNQRSGKASGFSVSIVIILTYYIILTAGKTAGERGIVHPAIAVWTPNVILFAAGLYLFRKTAREERIPLLDMKQSIAGWADRKSGIRRDPD